MRSFLTIVIVVVAVAMLAVLVDRGAEYYAEQEAESALTSSMGTKPEVEFDGVPFLTQWANGKYDKMTVTANQATINNTVVNDLSLTASNVDAPGYATAKQDLQAAEAASVRMSGTVPYSTLPLPEGVTASYGGEEMDDERVKLRGDVSLLGKQIEFKSVVKLALGKDGRVHMNPQQVNVLGPTPSKLLTGIVRNNLDVTVSPPGLPPGMKVSSLTAGEDGLRLVAKGTDVRLPTE